jgi:hypothetical protein
MTGRHSIALSAMVVVVAAAGVAIASRTSPGRDVLPSGPPPTAPAVSAASARVTAVATPQSHTPGAVSVRTFGASGAGRRDDTRAFEAAMTAARASTVRFAHGPRGPQAVVAVPAGKYRLWDLRFLDDVRLEVAAGAVLEPIKNPTAGGAPGDARALIVWDGPRAHPLTNVSIVGVGRQPAVARTFNARVEPGWDVSHSFVFDLDPKRTGGSNILGAMQLVNVRNFLVENVFSVQNGSARSGAGPHGYAAPTSSRAAITFESRNDSPKAGPFYDPHDGAIVNHYNVGGPYGYGPNQIASAHHVTLERIFSSGGTALRLETDSSLRKSFGGQVRGVTARHIVGVNCNRAVAFSPHAQRNRDVHVIDVVARSCQQGVIESKDESLPGNQRGVFTNSSVSSVQVIGGRAAQLPDSGDSGKWKTGRSVQPFARDAHTAWIVAYTEVRCQGDFGKRSNAIDIDGSFRVPSCG